MAQLKEKLFRPVHNAPEKFENATITDQFGFVFEEDWDKEITRDYRDVIVSQSSVFKLFSVHTKTQSQRFQIPPVSRAFRHASFS